AGNSQTPNGVLHVADDQVLVARAAGSGDGLVVGNVDRVRRQGAWAQRRGRIDRDAVIGLRRGASLIGGGDVEGFRSRGRGRSCPTRRFCDLAGNSQTPNGVLHVADDKVLVARAAGSGDSLVVGNVDRVRRQEAWAQRRGRIDRDA